MKQFKNRVFLFAVVSPMLVQAHIFDFSNHTNYPLMIGVKLSLVNEEFKWMEIQPGQQGEFLWVALGHLREQEARAAGFDPWKAGLCLQEIQVRVPKLGPKITFDEDGNKIIHYEPMTKIIEKEGKKVSVIDYKAPLNVVITWVKNEAYNAIVQAGKLFADGFADLAAKTAGAVLGVPMPEFKLSPIADAIGTWSKYSFCRDRHIDIVEDDEFSTETYKSFKYLIEARG